MTWRPAWIAALSAFVLALVLAHHDGQAGQESRLPAYGEIFVGPLSGWKNLRADYGAVGDGATDDTAAIQRALDELGRTDRRHHVLYLPSGVYRITGTLKFPREVLPQPMHVAIIGEDPSTTRIVWDGPDGSVMIRYNPGYSRMGRLTLDGRGRARTSIRQGPGFSTFNEFFDMVIQDIGYGIEAGIIEGSEMAGQGIAETTVSRAKFLRCTEACIRIANFNSLDWWVWDSLFADSRVGVTNDPGAGNFFVYQSVFRNSAEADIRIGNTGYFSIRDSASMGSRAFFVSSDSGASAEITIQRNLILDPSGDAPIRIGNKGTLMLLDNVVRGRAGARGPVVQDRGEAGSVISVGNTFTVSNPFGLMVGTRFRSVDDRVVERKAIQPEPLRLPNAPEKRNSPVIELKPGADANAIQQAIDDASRFSGKHPIVHLPAGNYPLDRTLVIPAGSDLRLVGDGIIDTTRLTWSGRGSGPVLRIEGPTRASVQELTVLGGGIADGIVVANSDQPGARIRMNQAIAAGSHIGLFVDRLRHAAVELLNFGHLRNRLGVKVLGVGEGRVGSRVTIFSGATSLNELSYEIDEGGWLLVRDTWYEATASLSPTFMRLSGAGTLTLHGTMIAHPRDRARPGIVVDGFRGKLSFVSSKFYWQGKAGDSIPAVLVKGDSPGAQVGVIGSLGDGDYLVNSSPNAQVGMIFSHLASDTKPGLATQRDDWGRVDDGFLRSMLAQAREAGPLLAGPRPSGASDVELRRVMVDNAVHGIVLESSPRRKDSP